MGITNNMKVIPFRLTPSVYRALKHAQADGIIKSLQAYITEALEIKIKQDGILGHAEEGEER